LRIKAGENYLVKIGFDTSGLPKDIDSIEEIMSMAELTI